MNTTVQRVIVLTLIAALLVLTRLHLPTTFGHIGPLPDASWAAFFIGGYYLRSWSRWAFPLFMAAAVVVDYLVISGQGINFWTHYCVSPAYWFLPFLRSTALYVGLGVIVHVGLAQVARLAGPQERAAG